MWYFTWILGIGLACSFAILNAMWYEVHAGEAPNEEPSAKGNETTNDKASEPDLVMLQLDE